MVGRQGVGRNAPLGGSRSPRFFTRKRYDYFVCIREMLRVGESRSSLDPRDSDTTCHRGFFGNAVIMSESFCHYDSVSHVMFSSTSKQFFLYKKTTLLTRQTDIATLNIILIRILLLELLSNSDKSFHICSDNERFTRF